MKLSRIRKLRKLQSLKISFLFCISSQSCLGEERLQLVKMPASWIGSIKNMVFMSQNPGWAGFLVGATTF